MQETLLVTLILYFFKFAVVSLFTFFQPPRRNSSSFCGLIRIHTSGSFGVGYEFRKSLNLSLFLYTRVHYSVYEQSHLHCNWQSLPLMEIVSVQNSQLKEVVLLFVILTAFKVFRGITTHLVLSYTYFNVLLN